MRALTIVGLKILGVSLLYRAAVFIPQVIAATMMMFNQRMSGLIPVSSFVATTWYFGISVLGGIVLICLTDGVAAILRVPDEPTGVVISPSELLRVGLVIVGIFGIISGLSEIARILYEASVRSDWMSYTWYEWGHMAGAFAQLLLAVVVIGRSLWIASRVLPAVVSEGLP